MLGTSIKNWGYLGVCALLVIGVAFTGNHFSTQMVGPRYWTQQINYDNFTIYINGTDTDSPYSNLKTVSDTLKFDITINNPNSIPVYFRYIPSINYTQKNIFTGTMLEKYIPPGKNIQFTYFVPLEREGISKITHTFSHYAYDERAPKTFEQTSSDIKVFTQSDQNTIAQQATILQYAWIPAIPLILASMKSFRDFWEHE